MRFSSFILACVGSSLFGCGAAPCATPSAETSARPVAEIPLGHASGQFHTLPVHVNDEVLTVAILDTGIGLALISQALCDRVHCAIDGEFAGRRMSGQEVRVPLTHLERLSVGGVVQENVVAGVIDIEGFFPEPQIEAFVGLPFFGDHPFTIDGPARLLTIESEASLAAREAYARALPIRLEPHGPALDSFVRMALGSESAEVLVDTGSRTLILHPRYAATLGVDLQRPDLRREVGHDETGNEYERVYAHLEVPVSFAGARELPRHGAEAMFQEIIHDGLIGTDLLSTFVITWDLARARMLVADGATR